MQQDQPARRGRDEESVRSEWSGKKVISFFPFFFFFIGKKWASRAAHAHTHTHVRAMCSNAIRNGGTFICLLNVSLLASLLTSIFFSPHPPTATSTRPPVPHPPSPSSRGRGRGRLVYQTPFKHNDNSPHISGVKGAFNTESRRGRRKRLGEPERSCRFELEANFLLLIRLKFWGTASKK